MDYERQYATFKTLDNMPRMLLWPIDDFLCLALPLFFALCTGFVYVAPLGFFLKSIYANFKKKMPRGAFHHKIYWILPTQVLKKAGIIKHLPPSHQREYWL